MLCEEIKKLNEKRTQGEWTFTLYDDQNGAIIHTADDKGISLHYDNVEDVSFIVTAVNSIIPVIDELEVVAKKGESLCGAYGNLLIVHHNLKKELEKANKSIAKLKKQ